jgi:beta-lactamase class D
VWYFQQVALDIGAQRMQSWLDSFDYGNRDISGGQDQFWLSSSLKISALEQIGFLTALDENKLPASAANQDMVKSLLLQDYALPDGFSGDFYGKTGSCIYREEDHGWFVGLLHRGDEDYVFAVNLKGKGQGGPQARAIAVEVMKDIR